MVRYECDRNTKLDRSSYEIRFTKVFVHTSTTYILQGKEYINLSEDDLPCWSITDKASAYLRSKSYAEHIVLSVNCKELRTVAVRPCMMITHQEHTIIPSMLDVITAGRNHTPSSKTTNHIDLISVENAAVAHVKAMHSLLDRKKAGGRVAGVAFNVSDGSPMPFCDVKRIICETARCNSETEEVKGAPSWFLRGAISIARFLYSVVSLGNKRPELNNQVVNINTNTFTYNISKARQVLGYSPSTDTVDTLKSVVQCEMQRRSRITHETARSLSKKSVGVSSESNDIKNMT